MRVAVLSFGNSWISSAILDDLDVLTRKRSAVAERESWPELMDWLLRERGNDVPILASSVNPPVFSSFSDLFPKSMQVLGRDFALPITNLTALPEQTGHDRLLDCLAAEKIYGSPLIVVDCGTAVTFNRIDGTGAFMGGAIAPGLGLMARSLAVGCAGLPSVDIGAAKQPSLLGRDTESAIRSGVENGYLAMVELLVERFLAEAEKGCRVVVTGGDGPLFVSRTSCVDYHDPDLVLKGLALAFFAAHK